MIQVIATIVIFAVLLIIFRIWVCLPKRLGTKNNSERNNNGKIRTIIVFGSGGHTTEALKLLESFGGENYGPVCFVLSVVSE